MDQKKRRTSESSEQSSKFITAARKAECDESESAFKSKLRRIAKDTSKDKPNKKT